jgi:hypothetical protein
MAGAEIIASAIGILCLIIFGYVLIGGILTIGENAASAQNDYIQMKESQLRISIKFLLSPAPNFFSQPDSTYRLGFDIANIGSETIGDFNHMDIYLSTSGDPPVRYSFDENRVGNGGEADSLTWSYIRIQPTPEIIHPKMLDPGETMTIQINNFTSKPTHFCLNVTTSNGITDTYYT